jgi:hypothetical protein
MDRCGRFEEQTVGGLLVYCGAVMMMAVDFPTLRHNDSGEYPRAGRIEHLPPRLRGKCLTQVTRSSGTGT